MDRNSLRQQGISSPFPVSPKGKPGRGRFPPRREHAERQQKALGTHRCRRLPPQEGCRPLVHPLRARWRRPCSPKKNMEKPPRRLDLTVPSHGSHGWVWTRAMHVQIKFLRLCKPVSLGDLIEDWRVCWIGGWDKCRVFFVVMVSRENDQPEHVGSGNRHRL
jgi:hypothetical protein